MAKLSAMQRIPPASRGLWHVVLLLAGLAIAPALPAAETFLEDLADKAAPLSYALSLIGTPYRFGGQSPETGLDCSGLVKHVYAQTAAMDLPRSAVEMSRKGEAVEQEGLKPGDLVFFNTLKRPFSHVGIYKGDGKFVHASSSRSGRVLVSDMSKRYWAQRFNGARRVLP